MNSHIPYALTSQILQTLITGISPANIACKSTILNINQFISNYACHLHNLDQETDTFCMLRGFPLQKGHTFVVLQFLATTLALYNAEKFFSAVQPGLVLYKC